MNMYAKHWMPDEEVDPCQPRNCEQCGELFTPPRNEAQALYCSNACRRKVYGKSALAARKLDRQRNAAEHESQPT